MIKLHIILNKYQGQGPPQWSTTIKLDKQRFGKMSWSIFCKNIKIEKSSLCWRLLQSSPCTSYYIRSTIIVIRYTVCSCLYLWTFAMSFRIWKQFFAVFRSLVRRLLVCCSFVCNCVCVFFTQQKDHSALTMERISRFGQNSWIKHMYCC